MHVRYYAVKDVASDSFKKPFESPSNGTALRAFSQEVNRKSDDNIINAVPADFELWYLWTFDDNTGEILESAEDITRLARAVDCLVKVQ